MSLLHIHLRDLGIMANHIQTAMPQQGLQRENIATRAHGCDRKSMSKLVRISIFHGTSRSYAFYEMAQTRGIEGTISPNCQQRSCFFIAILPPSQISPHRMSGSFPQVNYPSLATFCTASPAMTDFQFSAFRFKIFDAKSSKFGCPNSGIKQGQQNSLITIGGWSAHHKLPAILRVLLT